MLRPLPRPLMFPLPQPRSHLLMFRAHLSTLLSGINNAAAAAIQLTNHIHRPTAGELSWCLEPNTVCLHRKQPVVRTQSLCQFVVPLAFDIAGAMSGCISSPATLQLEKHLLLFHYLLPSKHSGSTPQDLHGYTRIKAEHCLCQPNSAKSCLWCWSLKSIASGPSRPASAETNFIQSLQIFGRVKLRRVLAVNVCPVAASDASSMTAMLGLLLVPACNCRFCV